MLVAAFIHASWNYFAKRTGGGAAFIWLFTAVSALFYTPLAVIIFWQTRPELNLINVVFILGTAVLHIAYFVTLQRGYRVGDLSLVYPLARGTGPFLATLAAIIFFSERPSTLALIGAGFTVTSVFWFAGGTQLFLKQSADSAIAIRYGLTVGLLIASYTLWDKYAVAILLIPPLFYDWASNVLRATLLSPVAVRQWDEVKMHWQRHRLEVFVVAILSPLSYILILSALQFSPVSYIAPAREISILIGAIMGASLLKEGDVKRRIGAALLMVIGVILLAIG